MVSTRKRKPSRTPATSKKVKAEEENEEEVKVKAEEEEAAEDEGDGKEDKQHPVEGLPVKDEHNSAADALKTLKAAGDVAAEGAVKAESDTSSPAKDCEDGNCGTESDPSANGVVDSSDEVKSAKETDHSSQDKVKPSNVKSKTVATAAPSKSPAKVSAAGNPKPSVKARPKTTPPAQTQPVAPASAPAAGAEATVESTGEVSSLYVGRVIGRGGEMIRDLQARSGCRIDVDQNVPQGAPRIITYRGRRTQIDFARRLVAILCTENGKDADLPLGNAVMRKVQVPGTVIGKIIGRGGEMIRKLQSESQAKIQVDHSGAGMDANHRQVTITGTNESVVKAEEMIMFLCANPAVDSMQALHMLIRDKTQSGGVWGSGPPYANFPNQGQGMPEEGAMGSGNNGTGGHAQTSEAFSGSGYGNQQTESRYGPGGDGGGANAMGTGADIFPCAKMHMGRVIGQKGVTINDLQKRSGCDIQVNQNVPAGQDCQISIKGSREGIEMSKQMLQDIVELGSNHPYAGGHGQFGRTQQGGGGGGGGQQSNQQTSFPSSYASQGQQPQMYSQQQYAMPQQQYGGQPVYQQQQPYQPQYGMHAPQAQPSPWRAATAADGQIYYYNQITQETQWDRPAGMQ